MNQKEKIILSFLKKYNSGKPNLKVIDIGAGDKPLEGKLPRDMSYISLDLDPKYNPDILCDLNKKLPLKDKTYDFVICTEVLEHTLYPGRIIKELKRITKDDGFLIITMPNEYNFYLRLKFFFGIQNNTEIPFRKDLWKNHIHKARVKDLINFYKECFDVKEITYSWDSFSGRKSRMLVDKFIRIFLMPLSKNLFSRSVIMLGR